MNNNLNIRRKLMVGNQAYTYFSIPAAIEAGLGNFSYLPFSMKVLLENLLRHLDGHTVTIEDIQSLSQWLKDKTSEREIAFRPARVLMQDFTGVPAVADLAAMRNAMQKLGCQPKKINPLVQVDLIIDHSVQVDAFATPTALKENTEIEMERNRDRYEFLRWGQKTFENFRVVPPGTGICHQVNLEYLAQGVWTSKKSQKGGDDLVAYPDTLVGTDSHTTMINGLGVLGWGVGGIEAEAALLGQPISMLIPEVIGVRLEGKLQEGITATDLVLMITQLLRQKGVVGKFVEFYGPGLQFLSLPDRATIANMAPEYGATCGFFPIDAETIRYLALTGRDQANIALVEAYCKIQGLWHEPNRGDSVFTDTLKIDLSAIEPNLAGPKRPQDRVNLAKLPEVMDKAIADNGKAAEKEKAFSVDGGEFALHHGDIVIAAITSCTNTSNPHVLVAAGLLAKNALAKGLKRKPWVKSSLAPGSKVVTEYLDKLGLQTYLDQLGFDLVGYGCTTCIGNSGPLPPAIAQTVQENDLVVASVLSGNRNFEGRVHPQVKTNWLASPPLVVAYALVGTTHIDMTKDPIGTDSQGQPVFLKDIWPLNEEVHQAVTSIESAMFLQVYADVFSGDKTWKNLPGGEGEIYQWDKNSTYIQQPPFFVNMTENPSAITSINHARLLALFGDSITTDHISPAGSIKADSPAGKYLISKGIAVKDFNSYGARRGNHEVMMRGTFANIRIRNELVPGVEGGFTRHYKENEILPIYEVAMHYQQENIPLIIIAGKEYGTGSSRDWAAKGTQLLGVKAVIAESFERIHRTNLVGMGVLPLEFKKGMSRHDLKLKGTEIFNIVGLELGIKPRMDVSMIIQREDNTQEEVILLCRVDTQNEAEYYYHGGILPYVLRHLSGAGAHIA